MAGTSQGALAARLVLQSDQFKAELGATASLSERELKRMQKQVQFVNDYIRETARVQKEAKEATESTSQSLASMSVGSKFVDGLRDQIATLGKSEAEVLKYKAAQEGVLSDAAPLILQLQNIKAAQLAKAEAEREAVRVANEAAAATRMQQASQESFLSTLRTSVATSGMSSIELLRYKAAQLGVTQQAAPLIASLERQNQVMRVGGQSLGQYRAAISMVPAQLTDIVTQLQGGQNPLTILIQQGGQLRDMFGGFGNMFQGLRSMITPVGVAVTSVAAAVGVLAYAYYEGSQESKNFAKSISLTGNYAGVTEGQYRSLAITLANTTAQTVGSIKDIENATIGTGRVGPQNFAAFVQAAARMQKATGQTADQVVSDMVRMTDSTTQWASESNKQYHFLSAAQLERIRNLEEQGRKEEAIGIVLNAVNKHVQTNASWWDALKVKASEAWDSMLGIGKADTVDDRLAKIRARLQEMNNIDPGLKAAGFGKEEQASLRAQEQTLVMQKLAEQTAATKKAETARVQQAGDDANRYKKGLLDQAKGVELLKDKIEELNRKRADAAKAGTPWSDADYNRMKTQLTKQYSPQGAAAGNKLASEFESLSKQLDNQTAKLKAQTEYWQKYGKSLDDSSAAVMRFRTQQGDLQKLTSSQKSTLVAKAEAEDVAKRAANMAQETAQALKRVDALKAEADAREQSARAAFIEQRSKQALGDSTDVLLRKQAEEAAARLYDKQYADQFAKSMDSSSVQIDKQVSSIDAETSMIGKSATERQRLTDIINVQASAQQLLAKYTDKGAEIDAWAAEKVKALTDARERQAEADRLASNGVASALATYQDNASSTAKLVDQAVTNGLSSMEDALTTFATTGKLSFKSFADSVVADITRIIIKQQIMNALGMGSGGSSIGGWLTTAATALFGGSTASTASTGFASAAGINGGRASGGPVMAGGMYRVNETGAPEMLESNGRSYLLTGGRDGRVTPASQVSGGTNFTQHLHITVAGNADARSAQQIAAASGRAAQRALSRNS